MPAPSDVTAPWLEVVMPLRNPGSKFLESVESLVAQTGRGFGVLLSDNCSTQGEAFFEQGSESLTAAGIPVRRVRPPVELGRVEHWNWAHHQGRAEWLKPVFAGDLLEPGYVATVRARLAERPDAQVVRCNFWMATAGRRDTATAPPTEALSLTPAQFLEHFPQHGNWLGGPINFAYTRLAWVAAGGFATHLPACADLNLHVQLALRHGLELLPESLAVFQLHEQRFSQNIIRRRVNGWVELWLTLREARHYCGTVGLPWPVGATVAGLWVQGRHDYWYRWKRRAKGALGG